MLTLADMHLTYRHSGVLADYIFTEGLFQGTPGDPARILEQMEEEREIRAAASTKPLEFENGYFKLPTDPGWGTDINLEALAEYAYKRHPASGRQVPPYYA